MTADGIEIIQDGFGLFEDVTDEYDMLKSGDFYIEKTDDKRMSKDNLRVFKAVKFKNNSESWGDSGFTISAGDRVLSAALGMEVWLGGVRYRIHELKYIIAKIED